MYVLFLCSSKMEYVAMVVCYSRCQLELIAQIIDFFLNINVNVKKNLQNKKDSPFLLKPFNRLRFGGFSDIRRTRKFRWKK